MDASTVSFPRPLALEYLQHLEALTEEINAGMDAVGGNALSSFQASVSKQQAICSSLCRLTGQMGIAEVGERQGSAPGRQASVSDRDLAGRILLAARSLKALNERYAALLKHSGESIRLFAGLCQSYRGASEPPAFTTNRKGWSYES